MIMKWDGLISHGMISLTEHERKKHNIKKKKSNKDEETNYMRGEKMVLVDEACQMKNRRKE